MRVFKFRAWEKKRIKTMCFGGIGDNIFFGFKYPDGIQRCWLQKEWGDPDFEVMQFTGLLDKNDKEIYESDVLKHRLGNLVVYWHDKLLKFVVDIPIIGGDTAPCDLFQFYDLECIGNIYENPELLK